LLLLILLLLRILLGRGTTSGVTVRSLAGASTGATCATSRSAHLLIVGLMLGQDLLSHLLLSLVDV